MLAQTKISAKKTTVPGTQVTSKETGLQDGFPMQREPAKADSV